MTVAGPPARRLALAAALIALAAAAAVLILAAAFRPPPSLDGLESLLAARQFDLAERRIGEFLGANPDSTRGHVLMAQVALARDDQKPGLALEHLGRIRDGSDAIRALVRLNEGKAYSALLRHDLAEAAWKDALRLDPRVPEAGWALLGLYYIQGRRGDARRLGLRLHATEPDPRDRVQLLVELLRQDALTPVYETLIPALEPAVRAHPEDLYTSIALGLALIRSSRIDEGLAILRDSVHRHAGRADAWNALLLGLDESRQVDELAEVLARLPGATAVDPRIDRYRGAVAQERRDWSTAADAYLRAWRADPSDLQVIYRLNRVLRAAGRRREAEELDSRVREGIAARDQALAIYREADGVKTLGVAPHPELYRRIADLRERMGVPDEALAWHRLVLRDQPDDPISRAAVARLEPPDRGCRLFAPAEPVALVVTRQEYLDRRRDLGRWRR
jgi:tetratricopeptide (TPR) repeat protein